ncbi:MAG: FAD-dependent oxidoreductase, partial [Pseudomonadota bacterium]
DFVIAAIPFPALKRIEITPALPMQQQSAIAQLPYTQVQKVHLTIDNEFWKQDGLPISMWTDTPIERVFPTHNLGTGELSGLMCWINGTGVRTSATDKDWFELAERTMRELRGANTRGIKVVRWDSEQPLSGGAYMHWAPGQISSWATEMGKPHGRLYFAGEHLSQTHTGMEGAIRSGELAAEQILERVDIV